jgi:hypothetical protein
VGARPPDGDDATTAQVTVVVVSYNGVHLLPDCMRALAAQDLPKSRSRPRSWPCFNNDARPEPDWLRRLLETFDGPGGRVAAATAKVLFPSRYLTLKLHAPEFAPGGLHRRRLGVRLYGVSVDGRDVTAISHSSSTPEVFSTAVRPTSVREPLRPARPLCSPACFGLPAS